MAMPESPAEALVRRAELVARAEELAAIGTDLRHLSESATADDLLALSVVMRALEVAAAEMGAACDVWGDRAAHAKDPLFARKLVAVNETLRLLSTRAGEAFLDAEEFAGLADA